MVRFGVWGLWDLGSHPPTSGGLGVLPPHQRSWGPCMSVMGGSGFWGLPISRGLGVPVGQIWGLGALGFGVSSPPHRGVLGSPPHVRGPGVPVGQIWGSLGFGVPPCQRVRFGGLWDLGSPHLRGSWVPCWSDLGSGGSGIWGPPPQQGVSALQSPISEVQGSLLAHFWGLWLLGSPMSEFRSPLSLAFGVPGVWVLGFPLPQHLGSHTSKFWGLWVSPMSKL